MPAEKKILYVDESLKVEIEVEPEILDRIAPVLDEKRQQLGRILAYRFSEYVNDNLLWQDPVSYRPHPVKSGDPESVKFCKHTMLAIGNLQNITFQFQEFLARSTFSKAWNLRSFVNGIWNELEQLKAHFESLKAIIENAGVQTQLAGLIKAIQEIEEKPESLLANFPTLAGNNFFEAINDYLNPVKVDLPENRYAHPGAPVLNRKANLEETLKTVGSIHEPLKIGLTLLDGLYAKLDEAMKQHSGSFTSAEKESIAKTKQALAKKDFSSKGFLFDKQKNKENKAVESDVAMVDLVKVLHDTVFSIHKALGADPDQDFAPLAVHGQSTAGKLPSLIKFGNRLSQRFGGALEAIDLLIELNDKKTYLIDQDLRALFQASTKTILLKLNGIFSEFIKEYVEKIEQFEKANYLRHGALSEEFRFIFDRIEALYLSNGLNFKNPFSSEESKEDETLKEKREHLSKYSIIIKTIANYLRAFQKNSEIIETDEKKYAEYQEMVSDLSKSGLLDDEACERLNVALVLEEIDDDEFDDIIDDAIESIEILERKWTTDSSKADLDWNVSLETKKAKERIRLEFFMRTLEKDGLNSLIQAVKEAKDHPSANLSQKNRLAALLADHEKQDRQAYLNDAHNKAVAFVTDPKKLAQFVKDLRASKITKRLAQPLAVELVLAGHTNMDDLGVDTLISDDKVLCRHTLIKLLNSLESSQITNLFQAAKNRDFDAYNRVALFNQLITDEAIPSVELLLGPVLPELKDKWLQALVNRYDKDPKDQELRSAIGLFVARIVHEDKELRDRVFVQMNLRDDLAADLIEIIEIETVDSNKSPALYYESAINAAPAVKDKALSTYAIFLSANARMLAIIQGNDDESKATHSYLNDPIKLLNDAYQFIRKLSRDSEARQKMTRFFAAVMAVRGNEGVIIRDKVAHTFVAGNQAMVGNYLELLSPADRIEFWSKVRVHLGHEHAAYLASGEAVGGRLLAEAKNLSDEDIREEAEKSLKQYMKSIHDKYKEVEKALKHADEVKKDPSKIQAEFSAACLFAKERLNELKALVDEEGEWDKKFKLYHAKDHLEAKKQQAIKEIKRVKSDQHRKALQAKIENYKPGSIYLAKDINSQQRDEIAKEIDQKREEWSKEVDAIAKTEAYRKQFEAIRDVFDPVLNKAKFKPYLDKFESKQMGSCFTDPSNHWQDFAKCYQLIDELKVGENESTSTKIIPEAFKKANPLINKLQEAMDEEIYQYVFVLLKNKKHRELEDWLVQSGLGSKSRRVTVFATRLNAMLFRLSEVSKLAETIKKLPPDLDELFEKGTLLNKIKRCEREVYGLIDELENVSYQSFSSPNKSKEIFHKISEAIRKLGEAQYKIEFKIRDYSDRIKAYQTGIEIKRADAKQLSDLQEKLYAQYQAILSNENIKNFWTNQRKMGGTDVKVGRTKKITIPTGAGHMANTIRKEDSSRKQKKSWTSDLDMLKKIKSESRARNGAGIFGGDPVGRTAATKSLYNITDKVNLTDIKSLEQANAALEQFMDHYSLNKKINTFIPSEDEYKKSVPSRLFQQPEPVVSKRGACGTAKEIYKTLEYNLKGRAHVIHPDFLSMYSIFDGNPKNAAEGIVAIAKAIAGFTQEDGTKEKGILQNGKLDKPIVIALNTGSARMSHAKDYQATGGSHWVALVLRKNDKNQVEISLSDSMNPDRKIPEELIEILTKKTEITFKVQKSGKKEDENNLVKKTHIIPAAFPGLVKAKALKKQQQGDAWTCAYWTCYNAIQQVTEQPIEEAMNVSRLQKRFPLLGVEESQSELKANTGKLRK